MLYNWQTYTRFLQGDQLNFSFFLNKGSFLIYKATFLKKKRFLIFSPFAAYVLVENEY